LQAADHGHGRQRAVQNVDEREAPSLAAERGQSVGIVFRVVFFYISGDPVVVSAIECIEEGPKCMDLLEYRES
jgi:hypothetical protein